MEQNTVTKAPPFLALPEPEAPTIPQASSLDLPLLSSSNPIPTGCVRVLSNYKGKLQEYSQRWAIPLPVYTTVNENEGAPHAPLFRSQVTVDGKTYTSLATFSQRKAAEQDAAKLTMECISKTIKQEHHFPPLIHLAAVFCKQILYEFAVKLKHPTLIYNTVQPEEGIQIFVSSLVFNGTTYMGDPVKSKKEAEQLAARAVITSLLGNSDYGKLLSEIIKSKTKLNEAFFKVKNLHHVPEGANVSMAAVSQQISSTQEASMYQPINAVPQVYATAHQPCHEFRVPQPETSSVAINPPTEFLPPVQQRVIAFVPPAPQLLTGVSPSLLQKRNRKKKNKNKNKGIKKARVGV